MQGKGGFLRILEAFIAIMIIAGVMGFVYVSQIQKPNQEDSINQLIRIILERIEIEENLREDVLTSNSASIVNLETEVEKFIPFEGELQFRFSTCNINEICSCESTIVGGSRDESGGLVACPSNVEVFSDEISVSVTLEQTNNEINPRTIRLFVWEK